MAQDRRQIVAWVGSGIVPHEPELRARLQRMRVPAQEVGDIVQEAYLRMTRLEDTSHILNPRAYFFATARSVLLERIRRERVVRFDNMTDLQLLTIADEAPDPERAVGGIRELERIHALIDALPPRCREIFRLRRIEGVPQRQIAQRLGVAEHTVEAEAVRGLKLILKAIEGQSAEGGAHGAAAGRQRREGGRRGR